MLALIVAASLFAGWIDAVIGGGGLILIPVLLSATSLPAASVLATNKVAAVFGTGSAAITLVRNIGVPRFTWGFAVLAYVVSAAGALLVSHVPEAFIRPIIIVLLLAVGIFVAANPQFGEHNQRHVSPRRILLAALAAACIGLYDGTFGPGTGMFLIIAFTAIFTQCFIQSAAMAKVINTATNLGALTVFIAGGHVAWKLALLLAVANIVGAQLGAKTVLGGGTKLVRYALLGLVAVLCLKLALEL